MQHIAKISLCQLSSLSLIHTARQRAHNRLVPSQDAVLYHSTHPLPNISDFCPVNYRILRVLQERVYQHLVRDVHELR